MLKYCHCCSTAVLMFTAVITIVGMNETVDEADGSVDICLMMDKEAEIPVSVDLEFDKNTDPSMTPAQG